MMPLASASSDRSDSAEATTGVIGATEIDGGAAGRGELMLIRSVWLRKSGSPSITPGRM